MDIDEIVTELTSIFSSDLPEFYKRRIVFWYDEACQFENDIENIVIKTSTGRDVRVWKVTDGNVFETKKLLCYDDLESDFLVYTQEKNNCDDNDWLTDIKLYSEEFRSDKMAFWIREMQLESTPALRECFTSYSKFLNSKERRDKIRLQKKKAATAKDIPLAILGVICDEPNPNFANILWRLIENKFCGDDSYLSEIEKYEVDIYFWETVKRLGYNTDEKSVEDLAKHIFLTAFTKNIDAEYLTALKNDMAPAYNGTCFDIVADWKANKNSEHFKKIAKQIEDKCNLEKVLNGLDVQDLLPSQFFPCINIIVLYKLMEDIKNDIKDVDAIRAAVQKRKISLWYLDDEPYFESLSLLCDMWQFQKEHAAGFHTVEPERIWNEYINDYYKMDKYYRRFHTYSDRVMKNQSEILSDLYKEVIIKADNLYNNWFLKELGGHWTKQIQDEMAKNGYLENVLHKQKNFYNEYVKYRDTQKIAVVISDAMRYEVATSLIDRLRLDESKAKIDLEAMQAIFPTLTEFGMTALLPQKKFSAELNNSDVIKVFADGTPATSTLDREKILQITHQPSRAIKADDLISWKSAERESEIGGVDVLYVYHNTIDEAGHTGTVFTACQTAIQELANIIRILKNENYSNIIITADHGFLCTNMALQEDDKVSNTIPQNVIVQKGRRYIITKEEQNPKYLFPVKFFDESAGLYCYTPYENVRIKVHSQNSEKFVHGGSSLQEMVVPVIKYRSVRTDSNEYKNKRAAYDTKPVEIALLSSSRKIVNLSFNVQFYQKDAVGGLKTKANYKLYFRDASGNVISDEQKIVADLTNTDEQQRKFNIRFKLKSQQYLITDSYYLVIQNEAGGAPVETEYQIDIATSVDGFDFFN